MSWRKKIKGIAELRQKILWDYKFGVAKEEPENYILKYESNPITSELFENTFKKIVNKSSIDLTYDDWEANQEIVIPKTGLQDNEKELLAIFPKTNLKKYNILSKSLDELVILKTNKGLIIKGVVTGLRKC